MILVDVIKTNMCAPIPKGRWSWKFEECIKCGRKNKKHKGRGLCISCHDKERAIQPKRQAQLKQQKQKWLAKVRGTEGYKKYSIENCTKWQKKNPIAHCRNWEKAHLKRKFIKFISGSKRIKNGLQIRINGKLVKTPIKTITRIDSEKNTFITELELFKKVYKEINERIHL